MDYPLQLVSQLKPQLRSLRKAKGWTQADLAQALNVSQSRVAAIEQNPGVVSVAQLMQILQLLGARLTLNDDRTPPRRDQGKSRPSSDNPTW